ncbi:MAG: type II secretion system F family protein [Thermoguttaceae bacterium]
MDMTLYLAVVAAVAIGAIVSVFVLFGLRRLQAQPVGTMLSSTVDFLTICGGAVAVALSFILLAAVMQFFGVILWFVVVFVSVEATQKYRASRQYGLLWLLTVSAERSMPLASAVEAFARERRGAFSRRARRLAAMLNGGMSLPDALDRCPGLLPRFSVPVIRVGCETNTLARALRQAAAAHTADQPTWMALQGKTMYLVMLPAIGLLLLTFLMLKIVPSFEKIYRDFGTTLPPLTAALIHADRCVANYWFLLLPLLLLGPFLLFYLPVRYFGWTDFDLPGMSRWSRQSDAAEVLDTLSLVASQERPLSEGLVALARSYPKRNIRNRLLQVVVDIGQGADWCESLCRHGLIRRPELAVLQAAQRVGNLPWALSEMADSVRRRLLYRVQALAEMLFPPVVILMGLAVLFVVVGLFVPLVQLIEHLT